MTRQNHLTLNGMKAVLAGSFGLFTASAYAQDALNDKVDSAPPQGQAGMMISPLRVEMPASETVSAVSVHNPGDSPLAIQVRLFSWTQQANAENFAPSSDLLVTPSIVSVPAGQTQIVRVLRKTPASQGEKQFKLVVDQLPDPAKAKAGQALTRVRFALPVFVDRDRATPPKFEWTLTNGELQVKNTGGSTARIVQVQAMSLDGKAVPVEQNSLRYLFGSNTIAWPVQKGCSFGKVRVTAEIDGQTVNGEPTASCG